MLTRHLAVLGVEGSVHAAGFGEPGLAPTADTTRYLATRGIDVSVRRSRRVGAADVERADLIVTAERMHVVEIAGRWPDAFERTMTLPEVVQRSRAVDVSACIDLAALLDAVSIGRPHHLDYLDADIDEIPDPTGEPPGAWRATIEVIDALTAELAALLAASNTRKDPR